MTPRLVLGPLLRHVGFSDATVWVETDAACEVEVLVEGSFEGSFEGASHRSRTFGVEGHHYALVLITDLEPGEAYEYSVSLDGERAWPQEGDPFPPPVIRTIAQDDRLTLAFGSCRVSVPHEPPYTLERGVIKRGGVSGQRYERDALYVLAVRMRGQPREEWPDALVLLGDQVYADEASPGTREFIRSRRDPAEPPGLEVAEFEEYTRSYWVYQHLGNLSPAELAEDELFGRVREAKDATRTLREFAYKSDREIEGTRWSYHRDFGKVRLIVMDTR